MRRFSALAATVRADNQVHVGEHETLPVNLPHPGEMRKLAEKLGRIRENTIKKEREDEVTKDPERGPTGIDEQAGFGRIQVNLRRLLAGIGAATLPWAGETAAPTEGKSNTFYGHKGLHLHSLSGEISHFRAHGKDAPNHADVHKTLTSKGYTHKEASAAPGGGTFHRYHHPVTKDTVSTIENAGKTTLASHRYAKFGHGLGHLGRHAKAPLPEGTAVHAKWEGGETEDGSKPDGKHWPATYLGQNSDGSHRIKWNQEGWDHEESVHNLHPDSAHQHHPAED